jgi:hypothetical protein
LWSSQPLGEIENTDPLKDLCRTRHTLLLYQQRPEKR